MMRRVRNACVVSLKHVIDKQYTHLGRKVPPQGMVCMHPPVVPRYTLRAWLWLRYATTRPT